MSRTVLLDQYYQFTPASRTIIINKAIPRERLILITDVTDNIVLYNFSDSSLTATSYTIATDPSGVYTTTTIVLNYNTTAISSSAKLQIIVDENDQKFTPSETYLDAVNKLRVSQPQSLIDTDFEYSLQQTKWEQLAMINNRPYANFNFNTPYNFTDIQATNGSRSYTVSTTTPPAVGSPIAILDSLYAGADGIYIVDSVVAGTSFSYTGKFYYTGTSGSINNSGVTAVYQAYTFSNANIAVSSISYNSTNVTVMTANAHNLVIGNEIALSGLSAQTFPPNGSWTVGTVVNSTAFSTQVTNAPTGTITVANSATTVQAMTGTKYLGVSNNLVANVGQTLVAPTILPYNTFVTGFNSVTGITSTTGTAIISTTGTVGTILGSGTSAQPWTATIAGMTATAGFVVGQPVTATNGTGSLFGGAPVSVTVAAILSPSVIQIAVVGGTTPTAGTVTNVGIPYLSTTAQTGNLNYYPMSTTGLTPSYSYIQQQLSANGTVASNVGVINSTIVTGNVGTSVINIASVANIAVGYMVSGTGVSLGTTVGAINGTQVTLQGYLGQANPLTAQAAGFYNFYPPGGIGLYQLSTVATGGTASGANSMTVNNPAILTSNVSITPTGVLYVKPSGVTVHRAFDGGVRFSTNASSHNHQMIRQTRRYFRYQSGKAIQMSTGVTLKPQMNIDQLTSSGTTVTVTTKDPHNINAGVVIQISGANEPQYNGQFTITNVISPYQFTYTATSTPVQSPASGNFTGSAISWYGNSNRAGIFDSQNGMYWDYDGQLLWAVIRTSVYQLGGSVAVAAGSNIVTGTNTVFHKQLTPGDFVVIKGMTYRVQSIDSATQIQISPNFRGSTAITNAQMSKTNERRIPQYAFNVDRMDGTGPSGYNIDLSRMQMFYIDYSWYGSGFVRFGVRGPDGNIIYCHRFINNNVNYLSFLRSGNLPGRYESNTFSKFAIALPNNGQTFQTSGLSTGSVASTDTSIYVSNTYGWPTSGSILIRNGNGIGSNVGQSEYANYTGISAVASLSGTTTAGSNTIAMASTSGVVAGQFISGPNIPYGAIVESVTTNTSIVISQTAFLSGTATFLFNPQLTGLTRGQAGASVSVTTATGSNTLTGISNTSGIQIGQYVYGTGIPNQAYVVSIVANTSVTLSQAAIASGTVTATFAAMGQTAQTFTITPTAITSVELHSPQFGSEINHWGTSAIMDGQFTADKQFLFTKGMTGLTSVLPGVNAAIMSFRVAPSASGGVAGAYPGIREVITRMQMIMFELDVLTNGNYLITLQLNGQLVDPTQAGASTWLSVGGSSMSQYIIHNPNSIVTGGEAIFGFYLNTGAGGTSYQSTQQDLTAIRDLGTSILGGGGPQPGTGIYPDGPDVITILAQNLGSTASNIQSRLSWIEAQA